MENKGDMPRFFDNNLLRIENLDKLAYSAQRVPSVAEYTVPG